MAKNLEYWIGKAISCRRCGNTRIIDWDWLNSSQIKYKLDKIARFSHCQPKCSICLIRGWDNIESDLAPWLWPPSILKVLGWEKLPTGSAIYWDFIELERFYESQYAEENDTYESQYWREDDNEWNKYMEWLINYEYETEGPEAFGKGPLRL